MKYLASGIALLSFIFLVIFDIAQLTVVDQSLSEIQHDALIDFLWINVLLVTVSLSSFFYALFFSQRSLYHDSMRINRKLAEQKYMLHQSYRAMASILEDLAQEKEKVMQINQQLSVKNQQLEQFVYTASHDLKAPLISIAGFTRKLEKIHDPDAAECRKCTDRILDNVVSMENLLDDLLELSRVYAKTVKKNLLDSRQVLQKAIRALHGMIHASQATIHVPETMPAVYAHDEHLFQVFQNILSNAIKYAKEDSPPVIRVHAWETHEAVCFDIQDNGSGIDPRFHEQIFEVFERLDPERGQGIGVGLTIVKTIMEKHQGSITVRSALNEGSCFSLSFPKSS